MILYQILSHFIRLIHVSLEIMLLFEENIDLIKFDLRLNNMLFYYIFGFVVG